LNYKSRKILKWYHSLIKPVLNGKLQIAEYYKFVGLVMRVLRCMVTCGTLKNCI
jgi:hypothetical protein